MDIKNAIERINFLYHKSQKEELTDEEKSEQTKLRRYYIDLMKNNLRAQIDTIEVPKSKRS